MRVCVYIMSYMNLKKEVPKNTFAPKTLQQSTCFRIVEFLKFFTENLQNATDGKHNHFNFSSFM